MHSRLTLAVLAVVFAPVLADATEKELTAELLAHGHAQVKRMLTDRPDMAAYPTESGFKLVKPTDPFYEWAVRKFAGEDIGSPVFWDDSEPPTASAEHSPPNSKHVAWIRVSKGIRDVPYEAWKGRPKEFELLWLHAIFELNNVSGFKGFHDLHDRALEGRIEREEYVMGSAKNEHVAKLKTMTFFKDIWLPWAIEVELLPSSQRQFINWKVEQSFEKWIARYSNENGYPWVPYGKYFDEVRAYGKRYSTERPEQMPAREY